jgi:hypothetical protein
MTSYSSNSPDNNANILNPLTPQGLAFMAFTGNINAPLANQAITSGRSLGEVKWFGQQIYANGIPAPIISSTPVARIGVQALANWNAQSTGSNTMPMAMYLQYSPPNASGSAVGVEYIGVPKTWLLAANNSTYMGGATNIEFKPIVATTNAVNSRSPTALGNTNINPQKWVDIGGWVQGNANANGQGTLVNITTTDNNWNGNVGLKLSRIIGNTASFEFRLPSTLASTLSLFDSTAQEIMRFTDNNVAILSNANVSSNLSVVGNITGNGITGNTIIANTISSNGNIEGNANINLDGNIYISSNANLVTIRNIGEIQLIKDTPGGGAVIIETKQYMNGQITPATNMISYIAGGTQVSPTTVSNGAPLYNQRINTYLDSGNTDVEVGYYRTLLNYNDNAGNIAVVTGYGGGYGTQGLTDSRFGIEYGTASFTGRVFTGPNSNVYIGSNNFGAPLPVSGNLFTSTLDVGNANATIAANGFVSGANINVQANGFMRLASYTAAQLANITGQIGWMAAVSDSAAGGEPNGMIAFWDTTNSRWSYIHDNTAV